MNWNNIPLFEKNQMSWPELLENVTDDLYKQMPVVLSESIKWQSSRPIFRLILFKSQLLAAAAAAAAWLEQRYYKVAQLRHSVDWLGKPRVFIRHKILSMSPINTSEGEI